MILVTGGTGFVGQVLIRHLVENGYAVRTLLRPSKVTPNLPKQVPVDIALANITDEESVRAALVGVDTVYHLVGGEWLGTSADLAQIDIEGTRVLVRMAEEAGVRRIVYLSHIGADRASAYPVMQVKGIAEEFIRKGSMEHTIIRSGMVFGAGDHFTVNFVRLLRAFPFIFPLPSRGASLLQPLWVEDLATCLVWAMENKALIGQTVEIGGPEFLSIRTIAEMLMKKIGIRRRLVFMQPAYMRIVAVQMEYFFANLPISSYWIDYLAVNRTTDIDAITRVFGLLPARFEQQLDYLKQENYRQAAFQAWFGRRKRE